MNFYEMMEFGSFEGTFLDECKVNIGNYVIFFEILSIFCGNHGDFDEVDKVNSQYGIENSFIGIRHNG